MQADIPDFRGTIERAEQARHEDEGQESYEPLNQDGWLPALSFLPDWVLTWDTHLVPKLTNKLPAAFAHYYSKQEMTNVNDSSTFDTHNSSRLRKVMSPLLNIMFGGVCNLPVHIERNTKGVRDKTDFYTV